MGRLRSKDSSLAVAWPRPRESTCCSKPTLSPAPTIRTVACMSTVYGNTHLMNETKSSVHSLLKQQKRLLVHELSHDFGIAATQLSG